MTAVPLRIVQVDAFTDRPFAGNPAAVCVLPAARPGEWMQHVAREMNLSETAFLVKRPDGSWDLRWFTPAVEVDLCGHATLASAHVLWESGILAASEQARFHTRSGLLTADRDGAFIDLDFPAKPVRAEGAPPGLDAALGAEICHFGMSHFDALVEVSSEEIVRRLQPDIARLKSIPVRGVIVTARASSTEYAIASRFFAPGAGVDEDPVTGSAHCALAPYWAAKLGRDDFMAHQASARGGMIRIGLRGDRVRLGGQAVTVMTGDLYV
jgi:predicted PhzF superfamily epimerase YddE/YHI9